MKFLRNQMILASAGSGKTYALTNRYIALLAAGAPPDRIAALTFTRKAAGEFFDGILTKLASAADSAEFARGIAEGIGSPGLLPADFRVMLRRVVDDMHRLSLGTLDGFFARVVRAFPLELGLGGDFEILQSHAAGLERRRVMRRMFVFAERPDDGQRAFIEAFKRATFGAEEKRLVGQLDTFLKDYGEIFLQVPEAGAWGRRERIWPDGCEPLDKAAAWAESVGRLRELLPGAALADKQRARWELFFADCATWRPGAPLTKAMTYIIENAIAAWPDVGSIMVERRRLALPADAAGALRDSVAGIIGAEFQCRLEMTAGLREVLHAYDQVYDAAVRRLGRLTFSDLQRLLHPSTGDAGPLSRRADDDTRLFIDWRLDARIDHWLLDEFQDTSYGQWRVMQNLIDETIQDDSGARSFFYVGDVKQAIYAWREGDSRLFGEIFQHYNKGTVPKIDSDDRNESRRSRPAPIEMINRVFGDGAVMGRLFPPPAAQRWREVWKDHTTVRTELPGFAACLQAADEPGRFAAVLRILRETGAVERGLTAAILVPSNEAVAKLTDFLRREGNLPAVAASDQSIGKDNPFACALLALFRAATHPRDTAARELVRLTPLEGVLEERGWAAPDALAEGLLRELHDKGFERTVGELVRSIEPRLDAADDFSRLRGRQLAAAARLFDEAGGRDPSEYAAFAEAYAIRDTEVAGAVQVMTVHKAKGLDFDLVILPDLEGDSLDGRRRGLAVDKAPDRSIRWVYRLPVSSLAKFDPVLRAHIEGAEADACYEQFCLLYVAMTRAREAMYVVTEPVGNSKSRNFPRLLDDTLGSSWSAGDPAWYAAHPPSSATRAAARLRILDGAGRPGTARRNAVRPSARRSGYADAAAAFGLAADSGIEFGTDVHALLAQVEWAEGEAAEALAHAWSRLGAEGEVAAACLLAPELATVWKNRDGRGVVWRERPFESILDGAWVTGIFDRVVITCDAAGAPARATVYDFKTERADASELAARYEPQLTLYRHSAATLAGLPLDSVSAVLIAVHPPTLIPLL